LSGEFRKFFRAFGQSPLARSGDGIAVSAGHLTFISLMSLMPLLGVALGVVQWFHGPQLSSWLVQLLEEVVAPGMHAKSEAILQRFIAAFSSVAMGSLSFFFLLVSAIALLQNLEVAFDGIWGISQRKNFFSRGFSYVAVLLLGPIALGFFLSGSVLLQRLLAQWGWPALSWMSWGVSVVLAFSFLLLLYRLLPRVAVSWKAALVGALGAGLLWELARHLYQNVAHAFYQYSVAWGSLGALPLFLMWLYLSWYLVLLGARFTYAYDQRNFQEAFKRLHRHPRAHELIGVRIAKEFSIAHKGAPQAFTCSTLAKRLQLPSQKVEEVIHLFLEANLLEQGPKGTLLPAKPLSELTLADISLAVGAMPSFYRQVSGETQPAMADIEKLFFSMDEEGLRRLRDMNWEALANL